MVRLEERERAFEAKFVHDDETKFRVYSLASRFMGLWAAEQLGLKGMYSEEYARHSVEHGMLKGGHENLLQIIEKDFLAKRLGPTMDQMRVQMKKCFDLAEEKLTMPL